MKKIGFLAILLFSVLITAQEKEEEFPQDINKKHELKINALTLIAASWVDVSYEILINEESSYGINGILNANTQETDLNYALTPFYRRYFADKFARGFFIEGFGSLYSRREFNGLFNYSNNEFETGFALGISVGGKFVSKRGFTTELLLGVGRNLANSDIDTSFGRGGISIGFRF